MPAQPLAAEDTGAVGLGVLVTHGAKSPTPPPKGCPNAPRALAMLSPAGEVVPLRCKRRHCPYCASLESRELSRVLTNDANEGTPPTVVLTLTTVDPATTLATFRRGTKDVFRRLRRRFGAVEFFSLIEFTTGQGPRSGGRRRMHAHILVKGLPDDALVLVDQLVRETWQGVTGAYVIEVTALRSVGGIVGYLALHHGKIEQMPPEGWEGQRVRWSRGYLGGLTVAAARGRARRELASERTMWSVEQQADVDGLPDEWVDQEYERRMRRRTASSEGEWRRLRVHPVPNPSTRPEPAPGARAAALSAPLHGLCVRRALGRAPAVLETFGLGVTPAGGAPGLQYGEETRPAWVTRTP